jgi:hypothetical protein
MDDISPAARWLTYAELSDGRSVTPRSVVHGGVWEAIRDAVTQLERAEQRVQDDCAQADVARDRAEQAEQRSTAQAMVITGLEAELEELRRHLNAAISAERTARDEAVGLRIQLDALRARGWWARLRNKTP